MKKIYKVVGAIVVMVALFFGFMALDWYKFTTSGEISATEGVFGNPKLEIWIDINARMPAVARNWACGVLLARQTAVMGREGAVPYSCQAGFRADDGLSVGQQYVIRFAQGAAVTAKAGGASEAEQKTVVDCVVKEITATVAPETIAAFEGTPTSEAIRALNKAAVAASKSCLKAIGT